MSNLERPFKVIVAGQITNDLIHTRTVSLERIGGVAYAASVFNKLGADTTALAHVGALHRDKAQHELERRQIRPLLFPLKGEAITYEIFDADEVVDQSTTRYGPVIPTQAPSITLKENFDIALVYPLNHEWAKGVIDQLRPQCRLIAVDLQHDVNTIDEAKLIIDSVDIVLTNENALLHLTQTPDLTAAVSVMRSVFGGSLIIKRGLAGCSTIDMIGNLTNHPAYLANFEITVGAGDAFDAGFLTSMADHDDLGLAANVGARVAAFAVENTTYNPVEALNKSDIEAPRTAVQLPNDMIRTIYIAGHFHSEPIKTYIERLAAALERVGLKTFVPHRDIGVVGQNGVTSTSAFQGDVAALERCDAIVALLDGAYRGGTYFELGYCFKRNIPCIVWSTDETLGISNMIFRSSQAILSDIKQVINFVLEAVAPA